MVTSDAPTPPPRRANVVRTGPRTGTPVFLLHSAGLELSYWDAQIEALGEEHDVIAVDLPGHGRTPGGPEDWTLDRLTGFAADALEAVGVDRAHVVGLSVGGILAQSLALSRPALVRSLVLVDTAATFTAAGRRAMRDRAATARRGGMAAVVAGLVDHWFTPETARRRPDLVDRATKTLLGDDPQVHAAVWEMIAEVELAGELPRIDRPTLVVVGELDSTSPVSSAQLLRDAIPDSRLRIVPRAAHLSPLEHPDTVTGYLREFLAEVG